MPKRISEQETKSLCVYMGSDFYDSLVNLAKKNKRSLSQQAAFMLEEIAQKEPAHAGTK